MSSCKRRERLSTSNLQEVKTGDDTNSPIEGVAPKPVILFPHLERVQYPGCERMDYAHTQE